jgi:hypothetical protein
MVIVIKKWSLVDSEDPYLPPERRYAQLQGFVYGHPKHDDGKYVRTSMIVDADGRVVKTVSGSTYLLDEPEPEYLIWLEENGYKYDIKAPLLKKTNLPN